jgi:NIMA (never in mitosis gene a)-related kinase
LHFRGILHRDIKCANIFKSKGIYKLGDLNVSKVNGDKLAYTQTGTPYYASPEVWRDEPYDSKSDIWSFGCIIYEMASLKPPFNGRDMEDLFKNVQKAKVQPLTHHYSSQLWEFIQLCLQKDPKKRPSAGELLKFIKKHNSNATSGVKINNPESNQLLKTIKVPHDLKKLNEALPTSKYRKNNDIV